MNILNTFQYRVNDKTYIQCWHIAKANIPYLELLESRMRTENRIYKYLRSKKKNIIFYLILSSCIRCHIPVICTDFWLSLIVI